MRTGLVISLAGLSFALGTQVAEFRDYRFPSVEKFGTELTVAQGMSRLPVRLIGFDCDDHATVVLAEHEDEFPERGCREIRPLDDREVFK